MVKMLVKEEEIWISKEDLTTKAKAKTRTGNMVQNIILKWLYICSEHNKHPLEQNEQPLKILNDFNIEAKAGLRLVMNIITINKHEPNKTEADFDFHLSKALTASFSPATPSETATLLILDEHEPEDNLTLNCRGLGLGRRLLMPGFDHDSSTLLFINLDAIVIDFRV